MPAVDPRTGLMARVWYIFLGALAKLPSARLSGSITYDPPNLVAGGTTTQAVTVSGATLGCQADASFSLGLDGLVMTAYVGASNTVTVVLYNPTAGAIDLGSGTLTAFVWQP
jgi:hypothetical protein